MLITVTQRICTIPLFFFSLLLEHRKHGWDHIFESLFETPKTNFSVCRKPSHENHCNEGTMHQEPVPSRCVWRGTNPRRDTPQFIQTWEESFITILILCWLTERVRFNTSSYWSWQKRFPNGIPGSDSHTRGRLMGETHPTPEPSPPSNLCFQPTGIYYSL